MRMSKPQYTTLLAITLLSLIVIGMFIEKWLTEADCETAALKVEEKAAEVISIGNDINKPLNLTEEQAKGQKWDLGTYSPNPQKTALTNDMITLLNIAIFCFAIGFWILGIFILVVFYKYKRSPKCPYCKGSGIEKGQSDNG